MLIENAGGDDVVDAQGDPGDQMQPTAVVVGEDAEGRAHNQERR
jgi:hypothetical protein